MNPQFQEIGQAFAEHYYSVFQSDREQLYTLYQDDSLLSFEGSQIQGQAAIAEKFKTLSFQSIQFSCTAIDCQPRTDGTIFVFVIGQIQTDDDPLKGFSQGFVIAPTPEGSFYIQNDCFRLAIFNY
eukprot:m.211796 g.211796  ORF g.211796 m.211796 type:complete len:126 (+) comp16942_c5_seq1:1017-1394(+)